MFTALMATPDLRYSTTCSAIRTPTISCASSVEPPMCGVASTASEPNSGQPGGGGSVENTSNAAPATLPECERLLERGFVHQFAARAVHDAHAGLHAGEGFTREHPLGLRGGRHVQGDVVAGRVELRQFHQLDSQIVRRSSA